MPWARHGAGHTRAFDDQVEWLAVACAKSAVCQLMRVAWRTVCADHARVGRRQRRDRQQALDRWCGWAQRCRIPAFVELARKIKRHRQAINAARDYGLSNALIESVNTKIRLITRTAFGFTNPTALIALAMLSLGGYRPALPGR